MPLEALVCEILNLHMLVSNTNVVISKKDNGGGICVSADGDHAAQHLREMVSPTTKETKTKKN